MKPKIVVLDGFTLSPLKPGETSPIDPSWSAMSELGDLEIYERTSAGDVITRAAVASILLSNKVPITREIIAALPNLKYIGVMATGTNVIDLAAAKERGIPVTNVPGYSTHSVVQIVFSLLFELAGRVGETAATVRQGAWSSCADFSFTVGPFRELSGKTFGVYGFGAIGAGVAAVASALGMRVLVHSRTQKSTSFPVEWVSKEEIFAQSDVLSLHCPLTPETQGLVSEATLALMKPGAYLINTGRGPLLDEAAVAKALEGGRLGGLGADVLSKEPPLADNPLPTAPNTVITPHIAWASVEARQRLMVEVTENVRAFLEAKPRNVVN